MLKAKVIPKVLEQIHVDGVDSSLLMLRDGSVLGSAGSISSDKSRDAHVVAAIMSNAWADYERAGVKMSGGELNFMMIECEFGTLGTIRIGSRFIAGAFGKDVPSSVLKANLERLREALDPILQTFDQPDSW